jgi:DNA-damage-inducible protein J
MGPKVSTEEFEVPPEREPNQVTRETMERSERGEDVHHAKDAEELFELLGI